ncbi:MAG TPA: NusA-like transcription termination signal-binding factor [Candidatus Nanoarchaeia archaeon]|nr:NusA-like transcription termination signal-binding factor [Candidatus Nanoarchaeia archaeon]
MQYDLQLIGYITTFESLTRAKMKDVFYDDNLILTFIVLEGEGGKAIGKGGSNVKRLGNLLKKRIRIIEFANDAVEFSKNCILPLVPRAIKQEENKILIEMENTQQKAMLLGRNKSNFSNMQKIVQRYYPVQLKVV